MKLATEMARETRATKEKEEGLAVVKAEAKVWKTLAEACDNALEQGRGFEIAGATWPERKEFLRKLNIFQHEVYEMIIEIEKSVRAAEKRG